MITKVIIATSSYGIHGNKGEVALLETRIAALRECYPDAFFTVFSNHPNENDEYFRGATHIQIVKSLARPGKYSGLKAAFYLILCCMWRVFPKLFVNSDRWIYPKGLREYKASDMVISLGGDVLTEDYGGLSMIMHMLNLLYGIILGKPVVIFAESVGPFTKAWTKALARLTLNRVALIVLREEISRSFVTSLLKSDVPIYVTADSAFLLDPVSPEDASCILAKEGAAGMKRPVVGISVSRIISNYGFTYLPTSEDRYREYVSLMARIIEYLTRDRACSVLMVPHVTTAGYDDRDVAREIVELVKHDCDRVIPITGDYHPRILKSIIATCDLFISSRMHAGIAAVSSLVPTIAIAYNEKTNGVMGRMLMQDDYVIDIRDLDDQVLTSKIQSAFDHKAAMADTLRRLVPHIRESAAESAKLVRSYFDGKKSHCQG